MFYQLIDLLTNIQDRWHCTLVSTALCHTLKGLNYIPTLLESHASFTMSKRQVHYAGKLDRKPLFLKLCAVKDIRVSKVCGIKEKSAFHFPKQLKYENLTCITILLGGFRLHIDETNSFLKCFSYRTWEEISPANLQKDFGYGISHMSINPVVSVGIFWNYSKRPRSLACVLYEKINHIYLINLCLYGGKSPTYRIEWYVYFYNIKQKENKPHWTEGENKSLGK